MESKNRRQYMAIGGSIRHRAISLIEGVLYLVVALAIIVGGIVFFQQANFNRQVNSVAGMMTGVSSYLIATTQNVSMTRADSDFTWGDATTYAIKSGAVQSDMVDQAQGMPDRDVIRTPWGGIVTLEEAAVTIDGRRMPIIALRINDVPTGACMRLGHKNSNGTSNIGGRVFALGVEENGFSGDNLDWASGDLRYMARTGEDTDLAALADACADGERDLVVFYEVSGTPDTLPVRYGATDVSDGGTDTEGGNPDGSDGGTDTGGGDPDGSGGGKDQLWCAPSDWVWTGSSYIVPGLTFFHKESHHSGPGARKKAINKPGSTSVVQVPNFSAIDVFGEYAGPVRVYHYWKYTMHLAPGVTTAPDPSC